MVLFGPYNRYQLHNHNQMTVAILHSHSFTEYPTDGSKLYPHCTITTCKRALHRKPTRYNAHSGAHKKAKRHFRTKHHRTLKNVSMFLKQTKESESVLQYRGARCPHVANSNT